MPVDVRLPLRPTRWTGPQCAHELPERLIRKAPLQSGRRNIRVYAHREGGVVREQAKAQRVARLTPVAGTVCAVRGRTRCQPCVERGAQPLLLLIAQRPPRLQVQHPIQRSTRGHDQRRGPACDIGERSHAVMLQIDLAGPHRCGHGRGSGAMCPPLADPNVQRSVPRRSRRTSAGPITTRQHRQANHSKLPPQHSAPPGRNTGFDVRGGSEFPNQQTRPPDPCVTSESHRAD